MLSLCCVRVFQPQLEVARVAVALHPSQRRRRPLAAVRGAHAPRHVGSGREHQSAERRGTTASRTRPLGSPARRHEHPHAVLPREYRVNVCFPSQYLPARVSALQVFNEGLLLSVHATLGRCFDQAAWSSCLQVIEDGIVGHRGD